MGSFQTNTLARCAFALSCSQSTRTHSSPPPFSSLRMAPLPPPSVFTGDPTSSCSPRPRFSQSMPDPNTSRRGHRTTSDGKLTIHVLVSQLSRIRCASVLTVPFPPQLSTPQPPSPLGACPPRPQRFHSQPCSLLLFQRSVLIAAGRCWPLEVDELQLSSAISGFSWSYSLVPRLGSFRACDGVWLWLMYSTMMKGPKPVGFSAAVP